MIVQKSQDQLEWARYGGAKFWIIDDAAIVVMDFK